MKIILNSIIIIPRAEKVKAVIDISMQETAVARNLTVKENLEFYASVRGFGKAAARERGLPKNEFYRLLNAKNG